MTNQNELKPCPRCPKSEIDVDIDDGFSRGVQKYYVGCGACGMSSGRYKTKEEAIAAWNARPAETLVPIDIGRFKFTDIVLNKLSEWKDEDASSETRTVLKGFRKVIRKKKIDRKTSGDKNARKL